MEHGSKSVSVARDGQEIGEWPEEQVLSLYRQGQLLPSDYYWRDGMSEWEKLTFLKPPIPQSLSPIVELPPIPSDTKCHPQPPPLPAIQSQKSKRKDFNWWDILLPLAAATCFGAVLEYGNAWARVGHPPEQFGNLFEKIGEGIVPAIIANMLARVTKRPLRWLISVGLVLLLLSYEDLNGIL